MGETVEQTVHREVMEEVGLKVTNLRYYKSQPWPPSSSLLFGFFCDLDGESSITLDDHELEEAEWILSLIHISFAFLTVPLLFLTLLLVYSLSLKPFGVRQNAMAFLVLR